MPKCDWPVVLILGIFAAAVTACLPVADENRETTLEPEIGITPAVTLTSENTLLPTATSAEPTAPAPLLPSPAPTSDDRKLLGGPRSGLEVVVPPSWADLSNQMDTPAFGNRLGINVLLSADSERTGLSLLAGKTIDEGAYISGLLSASPLPGDNALDSLQSLVGSLEPTVTQLAEPAAVVSANGVAGAYADVVGSAVGLSAGPPQNLRTRIALFTPAAASGNASSPVILLMSATADHWARFEPVFTDVMSSVRIFGGRPGSPAPESNVALRGRLEGSRDLISATLERGVNDVWTFESPAATQYASLFLRPEDPYLDLTLTLYDPSRRTIVRIDNGFAGDSESVTDLLLTTPGTYLVEVADFFREPGRYKLSLVLSDLPTYSGGGAIEFGQSLQSDLAPRGQHFWVFQGASGQSISIILEPEGAGFDAMLELIGPDRSRLVALDEGFSGDTEVISGFVLPQDGEYTISVRSFSDQGGSYTLSLDEGGQTVANYYDAGDLLYGDIRTETLQSQEAHAWFFQGKMGDLVIIEATPLSANLDLDVWLVNAAIERIAAADRSGAGEAEKIEMILPADGQYIILARDFGGQAGQYQMALNANPVATPESAGSLSYGDSVMGTLKPATTASWSFVGQAGESVTVQLQPVDSSSDLVLTLQSPDGLTYLEIDNNSAGLIESLTGVTLPASGQWQILVREFFGEVAGYTLSIDRAE